MLSPTYYIKYILLIVLSLSFIKSVHAQSLNTSQEKSELYAEILHMDSLLFAAFNTRNIDLMKTFFTKDLEVYQDNIGVRNYTESMNAFKNLFNRKDILQRKLQLSSLEVFPVKGYGAIQTGTHSFCHMENDKPICGTFRFVHVWQKTNDS